MKQICIVSKDPILCRLLELEISSLGFSFHTASDPAFGFDVCLIDTDTCQASPCAARVPVIFLGEFPENPPSTGGCFHLDKPFLLEEFRRVLLEAITIHSSEKPALTPTPSPLVTALPTLTIRHETRSASVDDRPAVSLSEVEYQILCRLRDFRERPLSAEDVKDILGHTNSNEFNVYICYLRRKLEGGGIRLIHTVRKKGYTLYPEERNQP